MSQQVSALNYVLNSFEEATKKDFKGFTLERSSIIYNAFQELQSQLSQGANAQRDLEKLKIEMEQREAANKELKQTEDTPKKKPQR